MSTAGTIEETGAPAPESDLPLAAAEARRPSRALVAAGLALVVVVAFFAAVRCGFVDYDNPQAVPRYGIVFHGITAEGVRWAFRETDYFANWLPLSILSEMLDWQLYGSNVAGHHLTSVLLHAGSVALLFLLLARTTGREGRAAAAALLWGVHPLRVESVVWLAERKDVLSGFFGLLTLLLYVRWTEERRAGRYLALAAAFAAALMSKSMVMTLPAVMLLLDVWPLGRLPLGRLPVGEQRKGRGLLTAGWPLVREKLPLFVMAIATAAAAFLTQKLSGAMPDLVNVPLPGRLANALLAVPRYVGATFWPARLSAFYPLPSGLPPAWQLALAGLFVVGVTAAALAGARRAPWLLVGWLWFVGMLLPVLGIVQVGSASHADRYTYLPGIGLTIAIVWGAATLLARRPAWRPVAVLGTAALTLACAAGTRAYTRHWRDSDTLFGRMVAIDPDNYVGLVNLGGRLRQQGRFDEAIALFRRAIAVSPEPAGAWNNLGTALRGRHDDAGAEAAFRRAIAIEPRLASAHFNLAVLYDDQHRVGPAAGHLAEVIAIDPSYGPAWQGLRDLMSRPGVAPQAIPWVLAVARAEPKAAELQKLAAGLRSGHAPSPPR